MTDTTETLAGAGVIFIRVAQAFLGLLGVVFVLGALIGNMGALAFIVVGVLALVLIGLAVLLEFVVARPVQRRWGEA